MAFWACCSRAPCTTAGGFSLPSHQDDVQEAAMHITAWVLVLNNPPNGMRCLAHHAAAAAAAGGSKSMKACSNPTLRSKSSLTIIGATTSLTDGAKHVLVVPPEEFVTGHERVPSRLTAFRVTNKEACKGILYGNSPAVFNVIMRF